MAERMDAAYRNTSLPVAGSHSAYECKDHAKYYRMLEEILHAPGGQKWAQCLTTSIEALYHQAIGEVSKSAAGGLEPAPAQEAEIGDTQAPLPKPRKGRSAATG